MQLIIDNETMKNEYPTHGAIWDCERQKELEALGFKVIRFSDEQILKNFEEVKKCIQQQLNQSKN